MTDPQRININDNPHLVNFLEQASGYYNASFSNRYMNWKRSYSITHAVGSVLARMRSGELIKILDVGCGNAWLTYRLKERFAGKYKLRFFGIDLSVIDIDFAMRRRAYFNHADCCFAVMNAQEMSFPDEEFDIIISTELLEHLPHPQKSVNEAYRILKKDGIFIVTTPNKEGGCLTKFLRLLLHKNPAKERSEIQDFADTAELGKTKLSSDQGTYGSGFGHISAKTRDEWLEIFQKAGFRIVSAQGTGGLFFGAPYLDNHRIVFGLSVILDTVLEKLPFSFFWSEILFFVLKKPGVKEV